MEDWFLALEEGLNGAADVNAGLDAMIGALSSFGLNSVNYDYSPAPLTNDQEVVTPALLVTRNAPDSMIDLWRNFGYYQIDPVMRVANTRTVPFAWSYFENTLSSLTPVLDDRARPVVSYLHDTRLTIGVTVPIRCGNGALATFTGIRVDPERHFHRDLERHLGEIGLAAYMFHDFAMPRLHPTADSPPPVRLTPREVECLKLSAQGHSAKQIAARLERSVGTVTLHLQNATRKLGARNRTHAASLAVQSRLIGDI
ncbi:MAG TPA: LuxR family transcriptional regulator [Dongiaceae bacterium]|jgi:LuxR family transcriptional regulator|nr:LuxR family transcriptional regulator [Dongiaceae bacterium]